MANIRKSKVAGTMIHPDVTGDRHLDKIQMIVGAMFSVSGSSRGEVTIIVNS